MKIKHKKIQKKKHNIFGATFYYDFDLLFCEQFFLEFKGRHAEAEMVNREGEKDMLKKFRLGFIKNPSTSNFSIFPPKTSAEKENQ